MHILFSDNRGKKYIVKRSEIRRVYEGVNNQVYVCFTNNKSSIIRINLTVEAFYNKYLLNKKVN